MPAIAAIARLAQRLGIVIARAATVADGDDDLDLWVRAEPQGDGVRLDLSGWHLRDAARATFVADAVPAFDAAEADFLWETDSAMRLTSLSQDAGNDLALDAASLLGRPLTRLFVLEGDDALLPILTAAANRGGFTDRPAAIRSGGRAVRLSAVARSDAAGRFAGFMGSGRMAEAGPLPQSEDPAFPPAFSDRLDRALRVPLARIVAHADSIGAQTDGPVNPEYVEYAYDIASAARHLMGLVDDLVDLQAIERPDFAVAAEPIDLTDIARRAGGLLVVRAGNADVRVERPDFSESVAAVGEFRRTLQILVNLVGNAVRYSPRGAAVTITADRADGLARVRVRDGGRGIAPADQARIFDKFGRVDPHEPGGTGLGLYIARRLARAMGGDLTVESAAGEGACFTLTLPGHD